MSYIVRKGNNVRMGKRNETRKNSGGERASGAGRNFSAGKDAGVRRNSSAGRNFAIGKDSATGRKSGAEGRVGREKKGTADGRYMAGKNTWEKKVPSERFKMERSNVDGRKADKGINATRDRLARGKGNGRCRAFGECGGCQMLHLPYEEQLMIKEKRQCPSSRRKHRNQI